MANHPNRSRIGQSRYTFEGKNGFGVWTMAAFGKSEEEAAQRIARRSCGSKAGAYPTLVDGFAGWQIATPDGKMGAFVCRKISA